MKKILQFLCLAMGAVPALMASPLAVDFRQWAPTPPMGWNLYYWK